ncbi:hypothetical protein [Rhodalgimonas zhirmunskyi]|uniref:Uncharacterized protein n=1 Tax=Rhodalgimonas zhirmunskyi TaxID=2964767 RepID=A0AAJ1U823_9RHOB|nr:hypothetical protein [Rhodoalgimonas zhirmunskyi]MDQ2094520.1 hypothetical protein [Rhodoalgimonas zhirmunskyi]
MTPDHILWWQNAASFAGIAVLAVPVLSLNKRKKRLQRLRDIVARRGESGDKRALDRVGEELTRNREREVAIWRRFDELCLYAGYILVLGSAASRLFLP